MEFEPTLYLSGEYDEDNPVNKDDLYEIYMVVYKVDKKLLGVEPKEIYSFTTIFEQAFKRFKIFPTGFALIKRILTDDVGLWKMAEEGTTKQWKDEDVTEELEEQLKHLKFSDLYGDIVTNERLNKTEENTIPVTYSFNKEFEVPTEGITLTREN